MNDAARIILVKFIYWSIASLIITGAVQAAAWFHRNQTGAARAAIWSSGLILC